MYRKILVVALGIVMLSGCNIYKKYETPTSTAVLAEYAAAKDSVDATNPGNLTWRQVYTDPKLAALIDNALAVNSNLQNAMLNVDIARANLQGARLSYLPSVALAPNGGASSAAGSPLTWSYTIPAQVSWEVDIFGKLLNSNRSAKARLLQSEAYAQAAQSQIISAVASTYYAIAALEQQLALSQSTLKLWNQTVGTLRDLKEAGKGVTEAAVVQAAANCYSIEASIADLETSLHQMHNTMSLLQNTMPQRWEVGTDIVLTLPAKFDNGIPMSQLAQRPDVKAAEQDLAVAYYATNSARAAFYPGLNISVNGGFTNLLGGIVRNPGDWFVQLAGNLTAPLFARGQNIARLKGAKAQQQQAMNKFEYALLNASAEVSDALTAYSNSMTKSRALANQVEKLEKAAEYTNELMIYSTGTTSYLEVLTAQQSLLQAQIAQINTQLSATRSIITLYQSLGGGR